MCRQDSYRNLTAVFQTFPGQNYFFFQTFRGTFTTPLREITCHMRSHSVTCHPAEVTFPLLPQPKLVLDLATPEGCKAELTWTARKLTNASVINRHLYFPGQHYSFQGFFQTFPYLWSFSRLFKALNISTLNSRTFHTLPGSVRTLYWKNN